MTADKWGSHVPCVFLPNSACSHELHDFYRLLYDVSKLLLTYITHKLTNSGIVLKQISQIYKTGYSP